MGDGVLDVGEVEQPAVLQHRARVAHVAHHAHRVRNDDGPAGAHAVAEHARALGLEGRVAHARHLVHEVGVEVDAHGQPEGEARAHPRGVGAERQVEVVAELGEVAHEVDQLVGVHPVDAAHEAHVLRPREVGVERAREAHGPGDQPVRGDVALVGVHGPRDHPEKRGLARPVAPQEPHRDPRREVDADAIGHHLVASVKVEGLRQVREPDHNESPLAARGLLQRRSRIE